MYRLPPLRRAYPLRESNLPFFYYITSIYDTKIKVLLMEKMSCCTFFPFFGKVVYIGDKPEEGVLEILVYTVHGEFMFYKYFTDTLTLWLKCPDFGYLSDPTDD